MLCLSLLCCFVYSLQHGDHLLVLLCVVFFCAFVTFPYGVPGHVWYLIVSITDRCLSLYFNKLDDYNKVYEDVYVWMLNFESTQ